MLAKFNSLLKAHFVYFYIEMYEGVGKRKCKKFGFQGYKCKLTAGTASVPWKRTLLQRSCKSEFVEDPS